MAAAGWNFCDILLWYFPHSLFQIRYMVQWSIKLYASFQNSSPSFIPADFLQYLAMIFVFPLVHKNDVSLFKLKDGTLWGKGWIIMS